MRFLTNRSIVLVRRCRAQNTKASLYLFTEGPKPRYAKEWLKEYEYLLAPSRFVAQQLEALDLPYILMPVGIDVSEFVPLGMPKFIDEKTLEQLGREARQHTLKYDYRETYKPLLEILR